MPIKQKFLQQVKMVEILLKSPHEVNNTLILKSHKKLEEH